MANHHLVHSFQMGILQFFRSHIAFLFFIVVAFSVQAQSFDPVQLQMLLAQKNISQSAFEARLATKGYSLTNSSEVDPEKLKAQVLLTIDELENEKKAAAAQSPNSAPNPVPNTNVTPPADPNPIVVPTPVGADVVPPKDPASDIYGMEILRSGNLAVFSTNKNNNPTDAYVLGPGDKLTINIWGVASFTGNYEIGADGYIRPDRVPPIFLKGMSLGKAKGMLRSRFGQFYSFISDNFEVIVAGDRTVSVNITGEVKRFGTYSISASHSAINALIAAGGPTDIGSLRRIKLIRNGATTQNIDIYEFLQNPTIIKDYFLMDNDYINVLPVGKMVQIKGAVRRPMKYELVENEQLMKLIEFAGGLNSNAYTKLVNIRRINNNEETLITLDLSELINKKSDFSLLTGDEITISTINGTAENIITLDGEFEQIGTIALPANITISALLKRNPLKPSARTDIAFIERVNSDRTKTVLVVNLEKALANPNSPDDIQVKQMDKIIVYPLSRYVDNFKVSIKGAVRNEGDFTFDFSKKMRLTDLVTQAGGLKPEAEPFAYIARRDPNNRDNLSYVRIDLKNAMANPAGADNPTIIADDSIFIKSTYDFSSEFMVSVMGEVKKEGVYPYARNQKLSDLLYFAGGLKQSASLSRIEIYRVLLDGDNPVKTVVNTVSVDENLNPIDANSTIELLPHDVVVVRRKPDYSLQKFVTLAGEVKYPGVYAIMSENEPLSSIIQRAGGLKTTAFIEGGTLYRADVGFVIIDMNKAINKLDKRYNLIIKAGDMVFIPTQQELVKIKGAHRGNELYKEDLIAQGNAIVVPFEGGKNAMYYIKTHALGVSDSADLKRITVAYPNGRLGRTKSYVFFKVYPKVTKGSTINIPVKPVEPPKPEEAAKEPKKEINWGEVLTNAVQQSLSVLSLILLAQRLN